jgi:hypothetical protein
MGEKSSYSGEAAGGGGTQTIFRDLAPVNLETQ